MINVYLPGSPTDKLMSPTSRKLRKTHNKSLADTKYGLQETTERLSFTEESAPDPNSLSIGVSNIVLGCGSITKRELMEKMGWRFTVLESNIDFEVSVGKSTNSPLHVAKTIAHALLDHFEDATKPSILITTAQVLKVGEVVYHPPATEADAIDQLVAISNQTVHFTTAVVVTICPSGEQVNEIDESVTTFQTITPEMAERLVKRNYTDKSKNLPMKDVELKLRCSIESGTEESLLGLPVAACQNALSNILKVAPRDVFDISNDQALPVAPGKVEKK